MQKIAWDGYLFSQPDSAFYFAKMQYDLAESIENTKQMSNALNTQGISFAIKGNHSDAIIYFKMHQNICKELYSTDNAVYQLSIFWDE